jgi:putative hydrolase of the HAD superfamily
VLHEDRLDVDLVAFDLDNTLYDEGLYFRAAFAVIAPELARKTGVPATAIVARLEAVLAERGRHYHFLFTDVLGELGLDPAAELEPVLAVFREIRPVLTVFPGVDELLADLGARYRLGLVTSGMRAVQENKLRLLGIAPRFAHIVFSSTLAENKPGRLPFLTLLDAAGVEARRAVYVGDNPISDFRGANDVGMWTVRVHNAEFDGVDVPPGTDARIKIARVTDLRPLLL